VAKRYDRKIDRLYRKCPVSNRAVFSSSDSREHHLYFWKVETQDFAEQADQVFKNLQAVAEAAGGTLTDIVKLTIYLTDLANFSMVNEVMINYFNEPFPARAAVGISQLPLGVQVEVEGVMVV